MSGFQEILILAVIGIAVLFLPRVLGHLRSAPTSVQQPANRLSGRHRLAIAASFIYLAIFAAIIQPWEGDLFRFLYIGLGPVVLAWLVYWVVKGFRNSN